jgi:PAS domain S-box-containing protein
VAAVARDAPLIQTPLLGEAIEHGPVAVVVFDEDGRYLAVNQFLCDLLGYTRAELLRMRLGDLAVDRDDAFSQYKQVATGDRARSVTRARRKDGGVVELEFRGAPAVVAGMRLFVGVAWPLDA